MGYLQCRWRPHGAPVSTLKQNARRARHQPRHAGSSLHPSDIKHHGHIPTTKRPRHNPVDRQIAGRPQSAAARNRPEQK